MRVALATEGGAAAGADPGTPGYVAAPMPWAIVSIAVAKGQRVGAGSTLLALEWMKMEAHVTADDGAEVQQLLVAPATACRRRN